MDQRFYASTYGRFLTPDPHRATTKSVNNPRDPGSWNRYAYTRGDPVNRADPRGLDDCDADICVDVWGWSWGDPLGDDFWASMAGPDFSPSAAAECMPQCYQPQPQGGGGVAENAFGLPPASAGDAALAAQAAAQAMEGVATDAFSPDCEAFIITALGAGTLVNVQFLAGITNIANAATANTPAGVTLFPGSPGNAAIQQNTANQATGIQRATLAQYSAASPNSYAWGQFGGTTVYYTNAWSAFGPALSLYSMLHEMPHIEGFGDAQIEQAFGISPQTVAAEGSFSITLALIGECGH